MNTPETFTREQVREIEGRVRAGDHPSCPLCGVPLDRTPVPPREDVSYVRDRVWLVCPSCRRSAVIDRR